MTSESSTWYLDYIKKEVEKLEQCFFTGNVEFQVNFKEGNIANINCNLKKSVKFIDSK